MNEFVRLSSSEKKYGAKGLLQSQVSMINLLGHFKNYEKLREQELILRIELKAKMDSLVRLGDSLDRTLPITRFADEPEENLFESIIEEKEQSRGGMDDEIDEIRRKLIALG